VTNEDRWPLGSARKGPLGFADERSDVIDIVAEPLNIAAITAGLTVPSEIARQDVITVLIEVSRDMPIATPMFGKSMDQHDHATRLGAL